ncbi:MAG: hypothetical protein N2Z59_01430 [Alteraurantiacibacter sp.]|nr:hypothetical protein [Alteraurantiacibacter sp.]
MIFEDRSHTLMFGSAIVLLASFFVGEGHLDRLLKAASEQDGEVETAAFAEQTAEADRVAETVAAQQVVEWEEDGTVDADAVVTDPAPDPFESVEDDMPEFDEEMIDEGSF